MKLEGHPQKRAILDALERRRLGPVDAFFENFLAELAVTGASAGMPCTDQTRWCHLMH